MGAARVRQCPGCSSEHSVPSAALGPEEEEQGKTCLSKVRVILVFHREEGKVWDS